MKMPIIKSSENEVKKAITDYLILEGWHVYRINNGGVQRKNSKGREFYTFAGTPGVADLFCVKQNHGFMWIETKATGKNLLNRKKNL